MTSLKCYYAHSIALFNTEQEQRDLATLKALGLEVLNPNTPAKEAGYKKEGMEFFRKVIQGADVVALRANNDGSINAGCAKEVAWGVEYGLLIIELPSGVSRRALTVEQTREKLREQGAR